MEYLNTNPSHEHLTPVASRLAPFPGQDELDREQGGEQWFAVSSAAQEPTSLFANESLTKFPKHLTVWMDEVQVAPLGMDAARFGQTTDQLVQDFVHSFNLNMSCLILTLKWTGVPFVSL